MSAKFEKDIIDAARDFRFYFKQADAYSLKESKSGHMKAAERKRIQDEALNAFKELRESREKLFAAVAALEAIEHAERIRKEAEG